ncbi:MAG: hypothetical protein OXU20_39780 [Myxococcales bacterium]|nr:hypothetical protein [Myxococcales bacterium]
MKEFMFVSIGFEKPTPEVMGRWQAWFGSIADRMVAQHGLANGREITKEGTRELPWGMESITGCIVFRAESLEEAVSIAEKCPIVASNRVYELRSHG